MAGHVTALLALALALGWAGGMRPALAAFALAAAGMAGWTQLPAALQPLATPMGVGITSMLAFAGLIADKFPGVDSLLDVATLPLRIPAAALLTTAVFGFDHGLGSVLAAVVGAALGGISGATKLAARAAVNTSPEPFSNIGASLAEDLLVLGGMALAMTHPAVFLLALVVTLAGMIWLLRLCLRFVRGMFRRVLRSLRGQPAAPPGAVE